MPGLITEASALPTDALGVSEVSVVVPDAVVARSGSAVEVEIVVVVVEVVVGGAEVVERGQSGSQRVSSGASQS
jgi:hypothetical protein